MGGDLWGCCGIKLPKGSIIVDPSMTRLLDNREMGRLLDLLVKVSLKSLYRVFLALSPFNANIILRGSRVYRVSVSHGAFIISPSIDINPGGLDEVVGDVCDIDPMGRLCWYLGEDVWVDARILVPKISLDPFHQCPEEYKEALTQLGLDIVRDAKSKVLCLAGGDRLVIDSAGINHLIIPVNIDGSYKDHQIDRVGGYRHPIAALLMGRSVKCVRHEDLEIPEDSEIIVRNVYGDAILYSIYDRVYVFGCKPPPEDLLFGLAAVYVSTHPVLSQYD